MSNRELAFYADTLILETILADDALIKTADEGLMSSLIQRVAEYFRSKIDDDNKVNGVLNMLAPGIITVTLRTMGLGWVGLLFGMAASVFHIDVAGMISSIYNSVKSALSDGKPISSSVIDAGVQSAVTEHVPPDSEEEITKTESFKTKLKTARKLKLAIVAYSHDNSEFQFSKYALKTRLTRSGTGSILGTILGWIFKVALASAGLLVAGDIVNKFLGRPNSLDGTIQKGKSVDEPSTQPVSTSTQTIYKINPQYSDIKHTSSDPWTINIPATESSIETMLINFAKDVYIGLDGKESIIQSTPGFQIVRDRILSNNRSNLGYNMVIMPNYLTSKKQIVDLFIDDVAKRTA